MSRFASFTGVVAGFQSTAISPPGPAAPSQVEYTTAGTYSWTVPSGVTSISALVVGGGGGGRVIYAYDYYTTDLEKAHAAQGGSGGAVAWMTNYAVTPGQVLTITVGAAGVGGSYTGVNARVAPTAGGLSRIAIGATNLITANGGAGGGLAKYNGTAPDTKSYNTFHTGFTIGAGVTGAGVYGQAGANEGGASMTFGAWGGGGAGSMNASTGTTKSNAYGGGGLGFSVTYSSGLPAHNYVSGAGGGVGIYGGSLSTASVSQSGTSTHPYTGAYAAPGGSGGGAGSPALSTTSSILNTTSTGGGFGGGGGGWAARASSTSNGTKCNGAGGAVRIIWPGDVRFYPNTRTAGE